ncbi:aquaporin-like isoform X2 [Homalodisca vitripennis]|uniref:aquaporin-like isoform X2 n=2 Tax=Homalodisca vitripennis TaxID=197043 RepID=UPI001EEB2CB7|nr:aquaporin-like isoform X2 [Homalodisca vitripennis]
MTVWSRKMSGETVPPCAAAANGDTRIQDMPARRQSTVDVQSGRCNPIYWQLVEIFFAEAVGTGMLLFFGCMGGVSFMEDVPLHPLQGAIVFAVVVATIIQIFGHISAAHLNPAVTVAFMVLGQVSPGLAVVYVFSEIVGAVLGFGLLMLLTPRDVLSSAMSTGVGLCCTVPHTGLSDVQAVAVEFFSTCFLVMVVCACEDPRNANKADSTPLKFGCTILALSIAVGPYTGASMNPVRSLGPALWNGQWRSHWVYWLGPGLGGFFTAVFYQAIFNRNNVNDAAPLEEVPLNQVKVNVQRTSDKKEQNSH